MNTCAYCAEESEARCYSCDRWLCFEHSHKASLDEYDENPDTFCNPAGDDVAIVYQRTGRTPSCGEGSR